MNLRMTGFVKVKFGFVFTTSVFTTAVKRFVTDDSRAKRNIFNRSLKRFYLLRIMILAVLLRIWWLLMAYYIAIIYALYEFIGHRLQRFPRLKREQLQRQNGKIAVITGGSRGIGLEIVKSFLDLGCSVIIGSSASEESRSKLQNSLQAEFSQITVEVWHLNLASMQSVKKFAEKFRSTGCALNLLINNAGIMFVPNELTEDGIEHHFAVNYLSHCLLTVLLLPCLENCGNITHKSRIVNSTSCIHFVSNINLNDLQGRYNYSKYKAYMQSKLAQVMFTYTLQSYLSSHNSFVTVNCVHPGVVNTELMSTVSWVVRLGAIFFKTAAEGAETAIYASLSSEMEGIGGKYLEECAITQSSSRSHDGNIQRALWKQTFSLLKPLMDNSEYLQFFDYL